MAMIGESGGGPGPARPVPRKLEIEKTGNGHLVLTYPEYAKTVFSNDEQLLTFVMEWIGSGKERT